jgi:hypothetical protein
MTVQEQLYEAINAARNYGGCTYVDEHGPVCVVAQFLFLRGITLEEMNTWGSKSCNVPLERRDNYDKKVSPMVYEGQNIVFIAPDDPRLEGVDRRLLRRLQEVWDSSVGDPETARDTMRNIVDANFNA